jgi:L-alanine-DL-glutamate epimerase-like enolase superfamily enzyme
MAGQARRIGEVRADHFRIPLPVVLSDSTHGEISHFELITLRLEDDEGAQGLGYTYTVGAGGGAILSLLERDLKPLLQGADPGRIEALFERMWWHLHFVGRGGLVSFAIAAADIALHDLAAKRAGLPLWRQLGGHDPRVPVYAGGIDLFFTLDQLLEQTRGNLEKGFRAIKMKVGRPRLSEDVERVRAMREMLGADFPLLVDANMGWRVDQAIRAARALAEHHVFWLEEPTIPDDLEGHVRIAREGGLPLATGENFHSLYEFQRFIAAGAVAFPEPDLATLGGVTPWLKVAKLAEAHNLPVTSHGVHDLHVHLLAAVPNRSFLEAHGFGLERFMEHALTIEDGHATAPDRPGHGVVLDWGALERLRA